MSKGIQRRTVVLVLCALTSGCLVNSVRPIGRAPNTRPDAFHAIVVIGMGLESPWPYAEYQLIFPEYSIEKQSITGNCFFYNRIDATRPSIPSKVTYLAFEVPANTYVYSAPFDISLGPSSIGRAFKAPAGGMVYFGDYVFVGNKTLEFRRDLNAARAGTRDLLPRGAVLELAESTAETPGARVPLCTP